MTKKDIYKILGKKIIKDISPAYLNYEKKIKVVVFVPLAYVDKLMFEMAASGAGVIGNYTYCSFRMKGVGTFKPGSLAKPFAGEKNKIAFEEEIRLEMQSDEADVDNVLDAMLRSHPYEEAAYELYPFYKRQNKSDGFIAELIKIVSLKEIVRTINKNIESDFKNIRSKFIAVSEKEISGFGISKLKSLGCNFLLIKKENSIILKIV
jgi:hypothetical protein